MDPRQYFSEADLAAIRAAAEDAERSSAVEVVPYIVGQCDDYAEAAWAGAALGAVAAAAIAAGLFIWLGPWGRVGPLWIGLPPCLGVMLGYLLVSRVPTLTRRLVPPEVMARHVRLRAEAAFLEEEVFATRDRSGVLVLLAMFERRAAVLADSGALAQAEPAQWTAIVDRLTDGVRSGQAAPAMVEAIHACAALLVPLKRAADDRDELSDEVRVRDR